MKELCRRTISFICKWYSSERNSKWDLVSSRRDVGNLRVRMLICLTWQVKKTKRFKNWREPVKKCAKNYKVHSEMLNMRIQPKFKRFLIIRRILSHTERNFRLVILLNRTSFMWTSLRSLESSKMFGPKNSVEQMKEPKNSNKKLINSWTQTDKCNKTNKICRTK